MRRVVITGMGTVNPLGKNVEEFWANIKANKNGLSYVDQFDTENFPLRKTSLLQGNSDDSRRCQGF